MIKITPQVDIAFKKIFGVEENKDLLISLINSVVSEQDQVEDLTLLNPYNPKHFREDKLSILDIKAKTQSGSRYNIEIQITDDKDYDKRALYYWAKLYTEQLQTAEDYAELNKAIGIHILNFTSIPKVDKYHNVFHLREKDSGIHFFKDIELHTIELNKFEGNLINMRGLTETQALDKLLPSVKTALDRWVTFLTKHHLLKKDALPSPLSDVQLEKAINVLETMNFSKEERELYEEHLKWLRIEKNTLLTAEEKGFARGKTEGMQQGIEKGKMDMAKLMLGDHESIEKIMRYTGLSAQEIEEIERLRS